MKYYFRKTIKIDITEKFLEVVEKYHIGIIGTYEAASAILGVSPSWFNTNYKKWAKEKRLNPKTRFRWLNDDGELSVWAIEVFKEYQENPEITLKELMEKHKTSSVSFYTYLPEYRALREAQE